MVFFHPWLVFSLETSLARHQVWQVSRFLIDEISAFFGTVGVGQNEKMMVKSHTEVLKSRFFFLFFVRFLHASIPPSRFGVGSLGPEGWPEHGSDRLAWSLEHYIFTQLQNTIELINHNSFK